MNFNGFIYNKLDVIRRDITDPVTGIPNEYGIYKWVYWPEFDTATISQSDLIDLLKIYSAKNFYIEEELTGLFKFQAKIWEQGYKENDNLFGLSTKKHGELQTFLSSRSNIVFFGDLFKEICFARPFYLGKANDLQQRIKNHMAGKSNVIPDITNKAIPEKDVWVGYKIIPSITTSPSLNTIFEEIYTRRVKPGLSIKPN